MEPRPASRASRPRPCSPPNVSSASAPSVPPGRRSWPPAWRRSSSTSRAVPGTPPRLRPSPGGRRGARVAGSGVAAIALLAALLAGCGGSSAEEAPAQLGPTLGTEVRLADCDDWKRGDVNERLGTIREIRNFAGGPVGEEGGHGATLEDEDAYQLFQSYCDEEFARGFKLYKLYTRAAAFGGLR